MPKDVSLLLAECIFDRKRFSLPCFWCDGLEHQYIHSEKCQEELKKAIQNLFSGRKLNKSESIRMWSSKR